MKLTLNREFAVRHLGVTLLMLGLSGWFAYDGFVKYPSQPESWFAEQHLVKDRAIQRQKEFSVLALLAALLIGGHLAKVASFRFEFDDTTFSYRGKTRNISEIKSIDRSKWSSKAILKVDGITLDAWHFVGVREFERKLPAEG